MRGGDPQPPEATLDYMLRFMNPLAASMVGNYLLGLDGVMPIADKIVIQQHDSHYGRMCEVLEYKGLPVYKVGVPADYTSTSPARTTATSCATSTRCSRS